MRSRKLKVMHLVYDLGTGSTTGGMENGVINLSLRLPSEKIESSICTFEAGGDMEARLQRSNIKLWNLTKARGNDVTLPFRLAKILKKERIDVLHTHNWGTVVDGIMAAKLARIKVIHGEHGNVRHRWWHVVAQRIAWGRAARVLAVSAALADRMTRLVGFPRERISVISNGVDTKHFAPSLEPTEANRKRLGLPTEVFTIGMVARLVPFKNHAGAFRALAKVVNRGVPVNLALAGGGPLESELRDLATELGVEERVFFLGDLPSTKPFLHSIDVLVSNSSYNEGMSNAVLEGMACNLPIIATKVAASPELLDGGAGLLISPNDDEALSDVIETLFRNESHRMELADSARKRAISHYSIDRMIEKYGNIYLSIMGMHA